MDENEILALRKRAEKELYGSIHSAVTYIGDKRYHFVEQEIPVAGILIHLPKEFIDLPLIVAKQKYPSEMRPKCIKSSTDITINFAFNHLPDKLLESELTAFRNSALDVLRKLYPQNTYLETGLDYFGEKKNHVFSWYEYYGPTIDVESYSFNALMVKDNRLLHFLFNCPKSIYEDWRPIVFETILTIRDKPLDWKGESEL
ncbi:MAG: hypothetical protein LBH28_10055 [Oscillospiraceae bacterium]|jgi:hypothetical protein|nr:hypothetical protein [Oscillospiraceae bacterium]